MRKFLLITLCLAALLLTACGGGNPSAPVDESTPAQDVSDSSATTSTTAGTPASGNEMDGADWFDTTTGSATFTTAGATGSGTTGSGTTSSATTGVAATTVAPPRQEELGSVSLPAPGYTPDGLGRIVIGAVSYHKPTVSIEVKNVTTKWMTEETNYLVYTCYDKAGNTLTLPDEVFGRIYIGQIRAGKSKTFTFALPEGTRRVEITGYHIAYWTEWA